VTKSHTTALPAPTVQPRLPLNALRAFEAAIRLGSMTAAAAELRVTHGAVSRHIKALEQRFALPLLQRLPRGLRPTPEGAALAAELSDTFDRIHLALSRVQPRPLTLSCSATMMMYWLLPRLGRFKRAYPAAELRLNISYGEVDFVRDEISVAIRNSMYRPPPNALADPLTHEEIGPICSPDYARRHRLKTPKDLAGIRLLSTATRPRAWAEWTAAVGVPSLPAPSGENYEHFYLVVQAAACGLGLGIVPRLLVESEIAAGHLVAPLGFVVGPHALELWTAEHLRGQPDVETLSAWLRDEMRRHSQHQG
jgi:DNA-binding transcriptional LysR family regulator